MLKFIFLKPIKFVPVAFITALLLGLGLLMLPARLAHAQGPVINLPDLPPGKVITITFRAGITTSLAAGVTQVCNQGTITGTNFAPVVTNDPTTPAANDATCTPIDLPTATLAAGAAPSEAGPTNGSFTLTLDNPAPAGGLTLNYTLTGSTAANPADYSLVAGSNVSGLTAASFTLTAGQSSGSITIVPVDDQVDDDGETVRLNLAAGSGYTLGATPSATQTIVDNDTRGVTVSESGGSTGVVEGGASDTYTIRLNTIPTATVTINFNPGTQLNAIASLIFPADVTALDPQTVTVTAINDTTVEGNHSQTITHSASGGGYTGIGISSVSAGITDNDVAYTFSANQSSVTEGSGSSTPISFTLTRSGDITRTSSVSYSLGGTATNGADYNNIAPVGGVVNFGAGVTQTTVTLDVVGDFIDENNESVIVSLSNPGGTGGGGTATISGSPQSTTITDDDTRDIIVTPSTPLTISEPAGSDTFSLRLASQPIATVVISLTTSTGECSLSASSVSLTDLNWAGGVTATVTAVDDFVTDGPRPCNIITAAAASTDPNYDGRNSPNVPVTVNDNDFPGFTIIPTQGLTTTEAGGAATFTVALNSQPTAAVNLPLSSSDASEGVISPTQVSFSTVNWNIPQTVTVTGANDDVDDGDQPYTIITNNPSSGDGDYNGAGANPVDVDLVNLDDDSAGFLVSSISGETTEDGITATFTIRLTSQPTANVTVPISSTDATEGTVSPASLSFTAFDWNVPQTVTVTGVDDPDQDGDINYAIQVGLTASGDPLYDNQAPGDVAVTNQDNDGPPISPSGPIYLPIITKNAISASDLVIDSLNASSSEVTVVLRNGGNTAITDAFWVDIYFNPSQTPSLNKPWPTIASRGLVWGVQGAGLPLDPGESLTLTLGDAFYFPQFSSTLPLPVGATVFGLVDSVDFSTTFGVLQESSEANNLFGPVLSTAGSSSSAGQSTTPAPEGLPDRE